MLPSCTAAAAAVLTSAHDALASLGLARRHAAAEPVEQHRPQSTSLQRGSCLHAPSQDDG
jgi:hypothetical protein